MKAFHLLYRLYLKFCYPVFLPEEIVHDIGIDAGNFLTFDEFVHKLATSSCHLRRLVKFMPREDAEVFFSKALRKEHFRHNTLFSYYFQGGWLEFILHYDEHCRLRRLYIQHKNIPSPLGIEIPLARDQSLQKDTKSSVF